MNHQIKIIAEQQNVAGAVLDQHIPYRWVGNRSVFMDWPPRSLGRSVCDVYPMELFEEQVYSHNIATDDELMRLIGEELLLISQKIFKKAYNIFMLRCHQCVNI